MRNNIFDAARDGDLKSVKKILKSNPEINATHMGGNTALHTAAFYGQTEVVKYLVDLEAYINCQNSEGDTPLHSACYQGKADIVRILLANSRINPGILNLRKNTPLHYACIRGHIDVTQLMLNSNISVNARDEEGCTALMWGCHYGHEGVTQLLLKRGVDLNLTNKVGNSALLLACLYKGTPQMIHQLLDAGADITQINQDENSPLHGACARGLVEVIPRLIRAGADVNAKNKIGSTPLHLACSASTNSPGIISILLVLGADPALRNNEGKTPLDLAQQKSDRDSVLLLESFQSVAVPILTLPYLTRRSLQNYSSHHRLLQQLSDDAGLEIDSFKEWQILKKDLILKEKHHHYLQLKEQMMRGDKETVVALRSTFHRLNFDPERDLGDNLSTEEVKRRSALLITEIENRERCLITSGGEIQSRLLNNCQQTLNEFTTLFNEWQSLISPSPPEPDSEVKAATETLSLPAEAPASMTLQTPTSSDGLHHSSPMILPSVGVACTELCDEKI